MVAGWTTTSGRPLEQPRTSSSYFWNTIRRKVIRFTPDVEKGGYASAGSAEECGGAARLRVGHLLTGGIFAFMEMGAL